MSGEEITAQEIAARIRELQAEIVDLQRVARAQAEETRQARHADLYADYARRLEAVGAESMRARVEASNLANVVGRGPGETAEDVARRRARIRQIGGLEV